MKKRIDFFQIAAIVLLCLLVVWIFVDNLSLFLYLLFTWEYESSFADFLTEMFVFRGTGSAVRPYALLSSILQTLPYLLLAVGLLAKKNRALLCLGAGIFAGQKFIWLSDQLTGNLIRTILDWIPSFPSHFSRDPVQCLLNIAQLFAPYIYTLCLLLAVVLFVIAVTRKKPLPAFLVAVMGFLPAIFLVTHIFTLCNILYQSPRWYSVWGIFKYFPLSNCIYPLFYLFEEMLVFFALVFTAGSLATREETTHKPATLIIGAGGGVLFLLANLLCVGIASVSMFLSSQNRVFYFDGYPYTGLLWILCFLLLAVGILLIPVAILTFRRKQVAAAVEKTQQTVPAPQAQKPAASALSNSLRELKQLQEDGLISEEDYEAKKKHLLGL